METWVLCLVDSNSGEPLFYYNPVKDTFEREFSNPCGYWSEESCKTKEREINVDGLYILKGTMDVPKHALIDSIMEVFFEKGLVKKD